MHRDPVRRGFTLIELIAVMVVLAVLVGVAVPKYFDYAGEARESSVKGTLGGVRAGIQNYFMNEVLSNGSGQFPTVADLNTLGDVMQENIPANPYGSGAAANIATVYAQASAGDAASRTLANASGGWAYYTDGTSSVIFYANTDTATVSENDW